MNQSAEHCSAGWRLGYPCRALLGAPWEECAIVQAAINLSAPLWRAVGTNIFDTNGSATFIATNVLDYPARYYRVVTH